MKKIGALLFLLATLLAVGSFSVARAAEAMPTGGESGHVRFTHYNPAYSDKEDELEYLPLEQADIQANKLYQATNYLSRSAAVSQFRREMIARTTNITVNVKGDASLNLEFWNDILYSAVAHTGKPTEGDYLRLNYARVSGNMYFEQVNGIYCYSMQYVIHFFTTAQQEAQVDEWVDEMLKTLDLSDARTDYDKIALIYAFVGLWTSYDYDSLYTGDLLAHSAYAAALKQKAVCQGYSLLLYRLYLECGIDSRIITSQEISHAWNIVQLGSKYYNMDVTWDSPDMQMLYAPDYFLCGKSETDFPNHPRDAEFETASFHKQYPMAASTLESDPGTKKSVGPWLIAEQPVSVTEIPGNRVRFSVAAQGRCAYQWQYSADGGKNWKNFNSASGVTNSVTFVLAEKHSGWKIRCVLTYQDGRKLMSKSVNLKAKAGVLTQPESLSRQPGKEATFSVAAWGKGGLSYRWQYSKDAGKTWSNVSSSYSGYNKETLSMTTKTGQNGWLFRCKMTTASGTSFFSKGAKLTVLPKITEQPVAVKVKAGETASFSVKAVGAAKLTYKWYVSKDGTTWSYYKAGQSITVPGNPDKDGQYFRCTVTDGNGKTLNSKRVKLAVLPKITAQPKAATVKAGEKALFSVTVNGVPKLTYKWYVSKDGGQTWSYYKAGKSIEVPGNPDKDGQYFRCVITDGNGKTLTSSNAKLTVK